jgi:hypothetical protein
VTERARLIGFAWLAIRQVGRKRPIPILMGRGPSATPRMRIATPSEMAAVTCCGRKAESFEDFDMMRETTSMFLRSERRPAG